MQRSGVLGRARARLRLMVAGAAWMLAGPAALACGFENTTPLRVLSDATPPWVAVTEAMAACGEVETTRDPAWAAALDAALAGTPPQAQIVGLRNDTIAPLLAADRLRPLDDLIAKHGAGLVANQLIGVDRETMAIAVMVDTRQLLYRADIFDDLGLVPPASWAEALAAAARIRQAGVVDHPMGVSLAAGPELARSFTDLFLAYGGAFYGEDGRPSVDGQAGRQALQTLAAIAGYVDPAHLTMTQSDILQALQQGRIAMALLPASGAAAVDDPAESQVVGQIASAPAPRAQPEGAPASTLWWEGIGIAKTATAAEAEAAFRVAMAALAPATVQRHNDAAIWLIPGYRPGRLAEGAIAGASATPPPPVYPSTPQMGVMQAALDAELLPFMTGARPADATLAAIDAAYLTAATEAGLID